MIRRTRVVALGVAAIVAGVLLSPIGPVQPDVPAAKAAISMGDSFGLNFRGTGTREPTAPDHFQYSNPLYSMANGEEEGTATHHVFFTEHPGVLDHTITFRLPDGELVSHELESATFDPADHNFLLIGIHPQGKTIVPEKGTGAYAGRTGKLRMKGWHGIKEFPEKVSFDDFYWIELDPK